MKVFLIKYSYHKRKWAGRESWTPIRIFAETKHEALEKFDNIVEKGYGFRLDSIEDVTGIPHKEFITNRTSF